MFKITTSRSASGEPEVRVEGRLDDAAVLALARAVEHAGEKFTLDLSDVTALSEAARRFVSGIQSRGGNLKGGSLYIKRLLGEARS
ncbi:MAG: hypothetical protein KF691_10280 [Phycisphaeraceae bacterium]|nr:hypothetical protein [Phycisphaeraceae bacterium]